MATSTWERPPRSRKCPNFPYSHSPILVNLDSSEVEQMTLAVSRIEALGGGWDNSQLPTPSQLTKKAGGYSLQK